MFSQSFGALAAHLVLSCYTDAELETEKTNVLFPLRFKLLLRKYECTFSTVLNHLKLVETSTSNIPVAGLYILFSDVMKCVAKMNAQTVSRYDRLRRSNMQEYCRSRPVIMPQNDTTGGGR